MKFFEKTTEIIDGKDAEPAEVQTILLREVQEWIAAGHVPPDDMTIDAGVVREQLSADEPKIERKPGVVRIVDPDRADRPTETAPESSSPETLIKEQTVEISIGSISVVVEGEDSLPQPAPAATPAQSRGSETPRRTSRLSRHYL